MYMYMLHVVVGMVPAYLRRASESRENDFSDTVAQHCRSHELRALQIRVGCVPPLVGEQHAWPKRPMTPGSPAHEQHVGAVAHRN